MIENNLINVIYLTQAQYDARLQSNTLETGVEYRITDKISENDLDTALAGKINGAVQQTVTGNASTTTIQNTGDNFSILTEQGENSSSINIDNTHIELISSAVDVLANDYTINGNIAEAVVEKSLGASGYIKYASGLIVQWVAVQSTSGSNSGTTITLPTPFTNTNYAVIPNMLGTSKWGNAGANAIQINKNSATTFTAYTYWSENLFSIQYIAIGY